MVEAEDHRPLQSKRKAITVLLPYAVLRERDGEPEMFDSILHAARGSRMSGFAWRYITRFVSTVFSQASPRAIVLASPYIPWGRLTERGDLIQWWAATASAIPYTEEVAQSVVSTLLQVAHWDNLAQFIPVDLWVWLTKRPSLPPICEGRRTGTYGFVIKMIRALEDIEVLKSYLLLVWSEWDTPNGFDEMCTLIREDFGGIGTGHHRADLIQRLDHVLGQLDRGLEYLNQQNHYLHEPDIQTMKALYGNLKGILLGASMEAIASTCIR